MLNFELYNFLDQIQKIITITMNRRYLFIISLMCGSCSAAWTQCPEEIYLITQKQIDSFSVTYPNCHQVKDLYISLTGDISNFKGLSTLSGHQKSIGILLYGKENVTFEGLENIDSVDYLSIIQSKTTSGLSGIKFINYLQFQNNFNFDLSGFTSLKHINYCELSAPNTENAPTFDLLNFPNINNTYTLSLNGNFLLNGIEKIDTISRMVITSNYVLKDMTALSNRASLSELWLRSVWTDFSFSGMEKIENLRLLAIMNGKKILSLDGLKNVKNIDFLSFDNIREFVPNDFTEMSSLREIDGLYLQDVNGLISLDGFPPSDTLNELFLKKNKQLVSISALNDVKYVSNKSFNWQLEKGIEISDNPNLSECSVVPVCEMLRTYPDSIKVIKNNGPKCVSIDEVISHCVSNTSSPSKDIKILFHPNPTYGHVSVIGEIIIHEITNGFGQIMSIPISNNDTFDLSSFPSGMYFIRYSKNNIASISKVIKI